MFRQRLLTALILIPIILWLVLASSWSLFAVLLAIILLGAAWEWSQLIPLRSKTTKGLYLCFLLIMMFWCFTNLHAKHFVLIPIALIILALFAIAMVTYPGSLSLWGYPAVMMITGQILLSACWWSLIQLKMSAAAANYYLLYLLLLIWATDTGAYFVGKLWGRHKVIVQVSPGKTYEGMAGGLILSVIVTIVAGLMLHISRGSWLGWLWLGFSTACVSILGDLLISMFKRRVNLKDTGTLLPGHGGILDRIDSLLAAALYFVYFIPLFS